MIAFTGVGKRLGGHQVLQDLSFHVDAGETLALLGLSGSGKTTALKLACGLLWPDQGEVAIDGEPLRRDTLPALRSRIGYVIQDGGLFPHLTAYQNVALVGREAGWSEEKIKARISELASLTKLSADCLRRYPRELSGGQRQRTGVMRALFLAPPLLLLDEPFGALDPITRGGLQEDVKDLCQRLQCTVLLVTHDLYEANFLAHRLLLLHQGRVAQEGVLPDFVDRPANEFVREFLRYQPFLKVNR